MIIYAAVIYGAIMLGSLLIVVATIILDIEDQKGDQK